MSWRHRFWRAFYDRAAFAYDTVLRAGAALRLGSEDRIRREVIAALGLPGGCRVLEIGCGTAANRAYLAGNVRYLGVDISRGMLSRAQRACAAQGLAAQFVQADMAALPLRASCADIVLAMGALQHAADAQGAINEMRRVASPGAEHLIIDERRSQKRLLENRIGDNVLPVNIGEYFVLRWK